MNFLNKFIKLLQGSLDLISSSSSSSSPPPPPSLPLTSAPLPPPSQSASQPTSPLQPPPLQPAADKKLFLETLWDVFNREGIEFTREASASGTGSILSVLVTHPLDVLKKQFYKIQDGTGKSRKLFHTARMFCRTYGFRSLFKGHLENQTETLFQTISMFYLENRIQMELEKGKLANHSNLCTFISGFFSATFTALAMKPFATYMENKEIVKCIKKKYGPAAAKFEMRRQKSLFKHFKGSFPLFMYLGVQFGLRFLIFNQLKDRVVVKSERTKIPSSKPLDPEADMDYYRIEPTKILHITQSLYVGALSGILAEVLSYPLEVVMRHQENSKSCRYYFKCIWWIWKKTRFKGLYAGVTPTFLKSMICVAIQFTVYEEIISWFDDTMEEV